MSEFARARVVLSAIGMVAAFGAAACGTSTKDTVASTSASSPSASAATSASATAAAPGSGTSNSKNYVVTTSSITAATPDGVGTWTLKLETISGGDQKVADAFNDAVKASAQRMLEATKSHAQPAPGETWNFETTPKISFSKAAVSELITGVYYAQQAAHPVNTFGSVVIDSRSGNPITLKELFTDEQKGLERLSQQTRQLLPGVLGNGSAPMPDEPGNAPLAANFANWIPTPQGIEINFDDGQFAQNAPGHGMPPLTIPWSAVEDLLAPGMAELRQS